MNSSASAALLEEVGLIGPAEDVYQALLEHLVAPLLPLKSSEKQIPSISEQEAVAKKMHAVVLLYNYYHRKCHPALELLGFESCCKLAVILKPNLMAHMKLMHRSDYTEVDDLESQLSLTEKAIMDACDISSALDATKDFPVIDGWPISKVAVLLVDSRKENCLLLFGSITSGIWSVIEKDIDASTINSGSSMNQKSTSYRRKPSRMLHRDELRTTEAALQQLAISAVKEIAGINHTDLMVLESHIVYSLSKEKTAARFFIVQSSQLINEDLQVPVSDIIESLQGQLVQKNSCGWRVTPVVKYFHVLPYAGILSDWISRELSSRSLGEKIENVDIDNSYKAEDEQMDEVNEDGNIFNEDFGVTDTIGNDAFTGNSESPKQKDNNGCRTTCLSNSGRSVKVEVDNSSLFGIQNEDKIKDTCNAVKFNDHVKKTANSVDSDKDTATRTISTENMGCSSDYPKEKNNIGCQMACFSSSGNGPDATDVDNSLLVVAQNEDKIKDTSNTIKVNNHKKKRTASVEIDKERAIKLKASKENALSQTALKVLLQKREKLSLKQRRLEDELALCDKHIQKILNGGEGDLALKVQAIIDGCNDVCLNGKSEPQDKACQRFKDQAALCMKRKRLSDAILTVQTPCQELDAVCCMNNWILPTYSVSPSNEGYLASINVKGLDFDLLEQSDLKSSPHESRESAAAKIIAKLKGIA